MEVTVAQVINCITADRFKQLHAAPSGTERGFPPRRTRVSLRVLVHRTSPNDVPRVLCRGVPWSQLVVGVPCTKASAKI